MEALGLTRRMVALEFLPVKTEEYEPSDRGSISFLLNGGTDSFTENFHLPPHSDRARGMVFHTQTEREHPSSPLITNTIETKNPDVDDTIFPDSNEFATFHENFMSFITGPFAETQKSYIGGFSGQTTLTPGYDLNLAMVGDSSYYEPEKPFSTSLIQSILARSWTMNLDEKSQQEISTNLHFLLTTRRILKFVALYFRYWHPNCPIIHAQSFDVEHAPTPLLASVVFMGAMYSSDERETYVAKRVLDFAELYIYSTDALSCENEVGRTFMGRPTTDTERKDWAMFQNFQAAYLMVVIQYWAGTKVSRNRAMETRFSEIILVSFFALSLHQSLLN
jgi:hypothetical protein